MNYNLRLVAADDDIEQVDFSSQYLARQIFGMVERSDLDFAHCLELCNKQGVLTPNRDYWDFARKNMTHFDFLFQTTRNRPVHENCFELANMFMMLVYLKTMSNREERFFPSAFFTKDQEHGNKLLDLIDKFAFLTGLEKKSTESLSKTDDKLEEHNTFHQKILNIFGF